MGIKERLEGVVVDLVKNLALCLNNTKAYPPGHPFVQRTLEETKKMLDDVMQGEELNLVVFETALFVDEIRIERGKVPPLGSFLRNLQKVGVNSITIKPGFEVEELDKFMRCLTADRLTLEEKGGIENLVKSEGIKHLAVNEVSYGIIKGGKPKEEKGVTIGWDSFISLLSEGKVDNPGKMESSIWEGIETVEDFLKRVERIAETILSTYTEEERLAFSKWLLDFVRKSGEKLKDKIKDAHQFNAWVAKLLREKLSRLSDDELVALFRGRTDFEQYLPEGKKGLIDKIKEAVVEKGLEVEEINIEQEAITEEKVVITGEKAYQELRERAEAGIMEDEFEKLVGPFLKLLEDENPEVRRGAVERIGEMIEQLLSGEKINLLERFIEKLKENLEREEDFHVYIAYTKTFEKVASELRKKGREDIADMVNKVFADFMSSEEKKKRAVQAIGKIGGKDALIYLLSALWEPGVYQEVRDAIVSQGREALPVVIEVFQEAEDKDLRRKLKDILIRFGEEILPFMDVLIEDERWYIRKEAASILSELGKESALPYLKKLVEDREFMVKKEAIAGIAKIGGEVAEDALISSLKGVGPKLLKEGLELLSKLGGEKGKEFIISLLDKEEIRKDPELFKEVIKYAGLTRKKEAVEPLIKIVEEKGFLGRPKYPDDVRMNVVYALARIGGVEAEEELKKLTSDPSKGVRVAAESALKRIGNA